MKIEELKRKLRNTDCFHVKDAEKLLGLKKENRLITINIKKSKWYIIGTVIHKVDDGFIGLNGIVESKYLKDYKDFKKTCYVEEYEKVDKPHFKFKKVCF